jgi:hypothetical protein
VAPGVPITASLDAGESRAYRIDALAGERLFVDAQMLSPTGGMELRLIDPFGRDIVSPLGSWGDIATQTLAYTGAYTLIVNQRADSPRQVEFRLAIQKFPPVTPIAIVPGVKSGSTDGIAPGKVGAAQLFGGVNYVDATHGNILSDLTVEAWVRPDRLQQGFAPIVQKGDLPGDLRAYGLYVTAQGALHGVVADGVQEYAVTSDNGLIRPANGRMSRWSPIARAPASSAC